MVKEDTSFDKLVEEISVLTHELARGRNSAPFLTITQEAILRLLKEYDHLTLKELKSQLDLDTYQISRLLSSVESFRNEKAETSLIKRTPHKADKRQWVISLSDEGHRVLTEELNRRRLRVQAMAEPLTESERSSLVSIIKKMTQSLRHKHKSK